MKHVARRFTLWLPMSMLSEHSCNQKVNSFPLDLLVYGREWVDSTREDSYCYQKEGRGILGKQINKQKAIKNRSPWTNLFYWSSVTLATTTTHLWLLESVEGFIILIYKTSVTHVLWNEAYHRFFTRIALNFLEKKLKPLRCLVFIVPHLYHILMIPKYLTFSSWPSLLYLYRIFSPSFWYQIYVGLPQEKVKAPSHSLSHCCHDCWWSYIMA